MLTVGDLAAFSLAQEKALTDCDRRRAEIVGLVDAAQKSKRRLWPF